MYERMLNKNEKPTAEQMASYCGTTSTMFEGKFRTCKYR